MVGDGGGSSEIAKMNARSLVAWSLGFWMREKEEVPGLIRTQR